MKEVKAMKKILIFSLILIGTLLGTQVFAQATWGFTCPGKCLELGTLSLGNLIAASTGIITGKGVSVAVQDLIKYFLTFMTLVAVIYIMYA